MSAPPPIGYAQAVRLTLTAAVEQAAADKEGPHGRPMRRGRDGGAVPIDRAAHRGGSLLKMGPGSRGASRCQASTKSGAEQ